ncbi:MAG: hypothetical protein LBR44_03080 [Clostridiales Family XIII bacterium]|jgi:hypothetical protein|nr:hypothetical protein [Clostridiales Family XIII bacterium]
MSNPFKFGSVVEGGHFTDRAEETEKVREVLASSNHLVIISPRRFGKTSMVLKAVGDMGRPVVYLDLLAVTSVPDFAAQLLRRVLAENKWESVKRAVASFRIVPRVELNPVSGGVDVSFLPAALEDFTPLEDVLGLIEKTSKARNRAIVILDEFQQVAQLGKSLPGKLRAAMQHHKNVNYVFLGSAESMMRDIFQSKKSPFYHFGFLMHLPVIPREDFFGFLDGKFRKVTKEHEALSNKILDYTECHPYNTQMLAYYCYALLEKRKYGAGAVDAAVEEIVRTHANDYERLWNTIRNTDKRILVALATGAPVSSVAQPTSTLYSGLGRLADQGFLIKTGTYVFDDPFFKQWIVAVLLA